MFPIANSTIESFTGSVYTQFLYFSQPITIYKEPIKNIISQPSNPLYGYNFDDQSTNQEVTYTSQSQVVSGLIIHNFKSKNQQNQYIDNKIALAEGKSYVKLKQDGFDYIKNGQNTQKIECDNATYNVTEKWQPQNFLGLKFYYFEIEQTY